MFSVVSKYRVVSNKSMRYSCSVVARRYEVVTSTFQLFSSVVDFFSRKRLVQNGGNSQTIETDRDDESSEKGVLSDLAVDSDFLALLNSALPLSNIRAMVAEQHRQDQEELTRVKKSLDSTSTLVCSGCLFAMRGTVLTESRR